MRSDASAALQTAATDDRTDLDARDVRALEQYLTVLDDVGRVRGADDLYLVVSESGREYLVDARLGACECPDAQHRDPDGGCKHVRRVAFATGARPVPADADVDPALGEHVAGEPRRVATDGGALEATPDAAGEPLEGDGDADGDGEAEDDCDCAGLPEDVPCFHCYLNGAEFPEGGR